MDRQVEETGLAGGADQPVQTLALDVEPVEPALRRDPDRALAQYVAALDYTSNVAQDRLLQAMRLGGFDWPPTISRKTRLGKQGADVAAGWGRGDPKLMAPRSGPPVVAYWGPSLASDIDADAVEALAGRAIPGGMLDGGEAFDLFPEAARGFSGHPALRGSSGGRRFPGPAGLRRELRHRRGP